MTTDEPKPTESGPPERMEDCDLLDLLIEGREDAVRDGLDPETRERLEEVRRVHAALMDAAPEAGSSGLTDAQMDAVVARVAGGVRARGRLVSMLRRRRMIAAAVLLFLLALAWTVFGPGGTTRSVYADVFGGIELMRGGERFRPVDHELRVEPGDLLQAIDGGEINLGRRYLIKVSRGTRLACLQLADADVVLELRSGRFRCESVPANVSLTLIAGTASIKTRDAVYSVQFMGRNDDQLLVDSGAVDIRSGDGRTATVERDTGRFSLPLFCSGPEALGKVNFEPCCKCKHRPAHARSYPTHTDPEKALALAAKEGIPVLITRDDGPSIAPCFTCCCFVNFNAKRHNLDGVVWLMLDPERHREYLKRYNLDGDRAAIVVLDSHGDVVDRGRVEAADHMHGAIVNLIRAGRQACKHEPR